MTKDLQGIYVYPNGMQDMNKATLG